MTTRSHDDECSVAARRVRVVAGERCHVVSVCAHERVDDGVGQHEVRA